LKPAFFSSISPFSRSSRSLAKIATYDKSGLEASIKTEAEAWLEFHGTLLPAGFVASDSSHLVP